MVMNNFRKDRPKPFHMERLEDVGPGLAPFEEDLLRLHVAEFFFISKGSGTIEVDLQRYSLVENIFYFLSPGQYRRLHPAGPIEGYYLALSQEYACMLKEGAVTSFFEPGFSPGEKLVSVAPDEPAIAELEETLRILLREYGRDSEVRKELLSAYTGIFLLYLSKHLNAESRPECSRENELTRKFLALVKSNFAEKKMVVNYAADLFISSNYLNQVIKRNTGLTASQHIQQRVILEAKRRAVNAPFRLKEIAYALGFEDCSYFSKYFKSKCGMSFTKFKKEQVSQSVMQ
jgi:AraC family transcriptional activator of pobA